MIYNNKENLLQMEIPGQLSQSRNYKNISHTNY